MPNGIFLVPTSSTAHSMARAATSLFGALCGAPVGFVASLLLVLGFDRLLRLAHPNDPSSSGVGILCLFAAPTGMILVAIWGAELIRSAPRVFYCVMVPLAIASVGLCIAYWPQRPHDNLPNPAPPVIRKPIPEESAPRAGEPSQMRA